MRVAALDLGSNSFLLLIAEVQNGSVVKVLHDEQIVTRLAQGVHENKNFHPEALKRAEDCFIHYRDIINDLGVESVMAVSTSAARDVENKEELLKLGTKYQIPISIISGEQEAELTYKGTIGPSDSESSIIDVGGGSTEIVGLSGGHIKGWSLNVGSVRLAEIFNAFDVVDTNKLNKIDNYIIEQIEKNKHLLPEIKKAIAVAGTPTTLSCIVQKISFSASKVNDYKLSKKIIADQRNLLASMSLDERKKLPGIHPKRADVLVCGVSILKCICDYFSLDELSVSTRGVRFGLAKTLEK